MSFLETPTTACVLLVAGVGSRLRPLTDSVPKALVQVGGATILERAVDKLRAASITRFVFATGYLEQAVREAVGRLGIDAVFCHNPDFESTQNSVSLGLCRAALDGRAFFKLDGDLLFESTVLGRLQQAVKDRDADLHVAVDGLRPVDAEAMKVSCDGEGRIVAFGKQLPLESAGGESIGIEHVSANGSKHLFEALGRAMQSGRVDRYYEDVYSELLDAKKLGAVPVEVGDLGWAEIDTMEDLRAAAARFAETPV